MNRNYIIKTISVPNPNKEKNPNEERITLEVISLTKVKTTQTFESGTFTSENFVFIGFEKQVGKPKTLYSIPAETVEDIIILNIDHYGKSYEFGRSNRTSSRTHRTAFGKHNNPEHSDGKK